MRPQSENTYWAYEYYDNDCEKYAKGINFDEDVHLFHLTKQHEAKEYHDACVTVGELAEIWIQATDAYLIILACQGSYLKMIDNCSQDGK